MHALQLRIGAQERLAQGDVERVDRAVAARHLVQQLAADLDRHRGLALDHQIAARVGAAVVHDPEALQGEIGRNLAQRAPGQQLEGGFGPVVGVALALQALDLLQQAVDAPVVALGQLEPDLPEARQDVGAPGLVGDHDVALVADQRGLDVLVGARVLLHRRDVEAALVREGRLPDVGLMPVGRAVQPLVQKARDVG